MVVLGGGAVSYERGTPVLQGLTAADNFTSVARYLRLQARR